jgi:hypothetical protein
MLKHHIIHSGIAFVIAAAVSYGFAGIYPPKQLVHSITSSKHAWADLTDVEKEKLASLLAGHTDLKVDILCNDAGCTDLAQDLDDALEDAKVESVLDRSISPLGYGFGVMAETHDMAHGRLVADALKIATDGRLSPAVTVEPNSTGGYVRIVIGKAPRK